MLRFGEAPYLECSSKGDRRFSAFYARVFGRSIESLYQAHKVFEDGSSDLSIKTAKGRKPVNVDQCRTYYSWLWMYYFKENPELFEVIKKYRGFSDIFGQAGHACQAEEIYKIYLDPDIVNTISSTDARIALGFN
jgi:hypothetical protein